MPVLEKLLRPQPEWIVIWCMSNTSTQIKRLSTLLRIAVVTRYKWRPTDDAGSNVDLARLRLLCFREHQHHDAVLQFSADAVLFDLAGELKTSGVVANIIFGIKRLKSVIVGEVHPPLNGEHIGL